MIGTCQVSITEPHTPTASIVPEYWNITRYCYWHNSLEKCIEQLTDMVYSEIIERKLQDRVWPVTNSDDGIFYAWLIARSQGSDAKMPCVPTNSKALEQAKLLVDSFLLERKDWIVNELKGKVSENTETNYPIQPKSGFNLRERPLKFNELFGYIRTRSLSNHPETVRVDYAKITEYLKEKLEEAARLEGITLPAYKDSSKV
jgi:hypothetical protein